MTTILLGFPAGRISDIHLEQVWAIAPDKQILVTDDRSRIEAALDDIEIAADRFPHDLIPKARNLRWLQQWGAGADWLLRYPQVADLDFVLTNASGVHAIPISEHIFAFLFAFARGFPLAIRAQVQREWVSYDQQKSVFELAGKTMLLIGLGAIGSKTASVAAALGMRVLAIRRNPSLGSPGVDRVFGLDQLLEALPQADFVVITLPLTYQTKGLLGEAALRAMKSNAYLINIGRGGIIREDVLLQALKEGWIAGAGLDVFQTEPLPVDSPLWALDNLIITGHYAGATPYYTERAWAIFVDNLQRYQAGKPLRNVVDKKLGY
ncbi:MAG: D-2-hydroxyacid dehydrogenase [Anaerolineae bacterium]|nr:D-2-hydroxyacid dehydrogenase [Anaerolineae bacterium]